MERDTRWLPAAQGHYRARTGLGDHLLPLLKNFMGSGLMTDQTCPDLRYTGQRVPRWGSWASGGNKTTEVKFIRDQGNNNNNNNLELQIFRESLSETYGTFQLKAWFHSILLDSVRVILIVHTVGVL